MFCFETVGEILLSSRSNSAPASRRSSEDQLVELRSTNLANDARRARSRDRGIFFLVSGLNSRRSAFAALRVRRRWTLPPTTSFSTSGRPNPARQESVRHAEGNCEHMFALV